MLDRKIVDMLREGNAGAGSVIEITPALAQRLIDTQRHNRLVSRIDVEKYLDIIRTGKFEASSIHAVLVSRDGQLLDGQHRMLAIIESGERVPVWVTVVTEQQADSAEDRRVRTLGDRMRILDHWSGNVPSMISALTLVMQRIECGPLPMYQRPRKPTAAAIRLLVERLIKHGFDRERVMADTMEIYSLQSYRTRIMPPSFIAYCLIDASASPTLYQQMDAHIRAIVDDESRFRTTSQSVARSRMLNTTSHKSATRNAPLIFTMRSWQNPDLGRIHLGESPRVPDVKGGIMERIGAKVNAAEGDAA